MNWPIVEECIFADDSKGTHEIYEDGTEYWLNAKKELHRDGDLPAVIGPDGYCIWFQNGEIQKAHQCSPEEIERFKLPSGSATQSVQLNISNTCRCNIIHLWNVGHEDNCPLKK